MDDRIEAFEGADKMINLTRYVFDSLVDQQMKGLSLYA